MAKEKLKKAAQREEQPKQTKSSTVSGKWYGWIGAAVIALLGTIIYSNSIACSFSFDDMQNIVNNPNIKDLSNVNAWWNFVPSRPLGFFSLAFSYHFSQLDVTYWHVLNIIIHLLTTGLVGWLTLLLFSTPVMKESPLAKHKRAIAFFTALLFVSHPLATESVTYIVQRFAAMVTMFYLFSIVLYLTARLSGKSKTSNYLLFAGSFVSAAAAMLTKENAFTLPFSILLIEFFFLHTGKFFINFKDFRILLLLMGFLCVMIIIPLKLSLSIFKPIPAGELNDYTITPLNYLLTQFSVIVKYIQLLFVPIHQNLDYDYLLSNSFFEVRTLLSFFLLVSLLVLGVFLFKHHRIISFGIFWFFLTSAIESSFIPINDVIFEHRTYMPSFGFFLLLTSGIFILLWDRYKYAAISILLFMAGTNSVLTYERNKVWKDELTLWSDVILKSPNKSRPYVNRASAYLNIGEREKALADYTKGIENNPKRFIAWYNRGVAYSEAQQWEKAIADFTKTVEINPAHKEAYSARGSAYSKMGKPDEAIADYSKAIEVDSSFAKAYYNRGIALVARGESAAALKDYNTAIALNPNSSDTYVNRGNLLRDENRTEEALKDYAAALALTPDFPIAYFNRGSLYMKQKQYAEAIADFSRAIQLNSNYAKAYFNKGASEYQLGKREDACASLKRAADLGYQDARAALAQICI
jgi:tetratricopeptide (TPR) repeat protein